tara:strand:+ start:881 stop:2407 length:1527 start_codon:yes stop_codon:yes gene_type:complete
MDILNIILIALAGLIFGIFCTYLIQWLILNKKLSSANEKVEEIIEDANEKKRVILIDAKEQSIKIRAAGEREIRDRRVEIQKSERRVINRESNVEGRAKNLEKREKDITKKESSISQTQLEIEDIKGKFVEQLEIQSGFTSTEAKNILMEKASEDIQHEVNLKYKDVEEKAKLDAEEKARKVLATVIQRHASDVVAEKTVTSVPLPSSDMKGRLIGREGRNIRAIEKATGVDLIIDETPEAVTISCFNPIRREIARLALVKLITDGRIHPARIEDMVVKAEEELEKTIWKSGEEAVFDVGVRGLNPEIIKLVGRLKYRYSYGENVLQHSLEVGHIAGMIAAEIGADVNIARAGGFLHDIGKALTHEVEGPHAEIGADIAKKHGVQEPVVKCIAEHHDDEMSSVESYIVAASDAISAARPGARKDTVENYIKRLQELENIGKEFDGVEKCFAIQAGREIRILVSPENVNDDSADQMARDIAKKIEDDLTYPGQIKVTLIRESRSIEYAR